jgi:hypothetical protein
MQHEIDKRGRVFKGAAYMTDNPDVVIEELQRAIIWNRSKQNK